MVYITEFPMFLASVLLISLSGVLMPGPLFAITIKKAAKSKISGALIAIGHGVVEFPLMFLIFFILSEVEVPMIAQIAVGLVGGALMIFMGVQTYHNRHRQEAFTISPKRDSVIAGIYTTAANAGFILWWLTIGTTLILNAKLFGLLGFSIFAGVHWFTDFAWYTAAAFLIFKSQRFWNDRVRMGITLFCVVVFIGFGAFFMGSALWSLLA
ncbi:MAG: LysE family translocator [Candidatus Bathyarchaeota archaeon]|nr:LysE family translocator [Candidatus Bathyarchaeota archaeon]